MNNINPSHYFERIEEYLHTANGMKPLQTMEKLVKVVGTPAVLVDSIVNGVILDFMLKKGFVIMEPLTGVLYKGTALIRRSPLSL